MTNGCGITRCNGHGDYSACGQEDRGEIYFCEDCLRKMLKATYLELQRWQSGPFICGMGGELLENGMREVIHVCPSYGSDAIYAYKITEFKKV